MLNIMWDTLYTASGDEVYLSKMNVVWNTFIQLCYYYMEGKHNAHKKIQITYLSNYCATVALKSNVKCSGIIWFLKLLSDTK